VVGVGAVGECKGRPGPELQTQEESQDEGSAQVEEGIPETIESGREWELNSTSMREGPGVGAGGGQGKSRQGQGAGG